jgi:hypothetical protein
MLNMSGVFLIEKCAESSEQERIRWTRHEMCSFIFLRGISMTISRRFLLNTLGATGTLGAVSYSRVNVEFNFCSWQNSTRRTVRVNCG